MINQLSIPLSAEQEMLLNNLRSLVKRQIRPTSLTPIEVVADLLLKYTPMMRDIGLSAELLDYLNQVQYRLPENTPLYARLLVEIAITTNITGLPDDADALFHQALDLYATFGTNDIWAAYANTHTTYGRFLVGRGQLKEGIAHYRQAIQMLNHSDFLLEMATAESELGLALTGRGYFKEAVSYFEHALTALKQQSLSPQLIRTQADYATALIQLGQLDRAETILQEALEACEILKLWALRGQVRHVLAYVYQSRAESSQDNAQKQRYLNQAETLLNQAITDLLPLSQSTELAVVYHDLSRLEARQRKFTEAEDHVRLSSELFARVGNRRNLAVAQITLGQMLMLKNGDAFAAAERIRQALKIAGDLGDKHTQQQAAESLIRIHRMQAKRIATEPEHRADILSQIAYSRARFDALNLTESSAILQALQDELA